MRFRELLEYKRDITVNNLGQQLVKAVTLGAQSSVGNTVQKIKQIIPGIEIGSGRDDADVQTTLAALGAHIHEVLKFFEDADPTPNKQYTEWMVRRYIDGGIRYLEDVDSTVAENLAIYHELKIRRMIPPELADIGKVKGNQVARFFRDVYNIYRELPEQQEKDRGEYRDVFDDEDVRVLVPENQQAACYYGQGTRWCTAATRGRNYFKHYADEGDLYIVIPKNPQHEGEKYQLHFETNSYMNEDDQSVDPVFLLTQRFPQLHKFFHEDVKYAYRITHGSKASVLLAEPETLENWEDIIEDKVKPAVLKELETPVSVYNWLGLAPFVSGANAIIDSDYYTKDEKFLAKKKIKWINKIAEHISKNKDQVMSVIDRTIGDLDVVNQSLSIVNGGLPNKAITAIPTMFPGTDTMETDIGSHRVSSGIIIKILNKVWSKFAFLINPYFGDAFEL